MTEKYKNRDWLEEKYHKEKLSQREISNLCDVGRKTIGRWMKKLNVETRDKGLEMSIAQQNCSGNHRDKEWLEEKYVNKGNSFKSVANLCGCNHETVRTWVKKFNLNIRTGHETRSFGRETKYKNKDWLRKQYCEEEKTLKEISKSCGVNKEAIGKWLNKHNIESRSRSERALSCSMKHESRDWLLKKKKDGLKKSEMADICGCSKDTIDKRMSSFGINQNDHLNCSGNHRSEDWLFENYHTKGLIMKEMAEECGCTQTTISKWLQKFNIKTQSGKFNTGESHWNYKNGNSKKEELDFRKSNEWKRFSLQKKKEADWRCEYCLGSGRLHTHHVKPVSMGGDKWDNDFIVLCKDCHIGNYDKWHPPLLKQYI